MKERVDLKGAGMTAWRRLPQTAGYASNVSEARS